MKYKVGDYVFVQYETDPLYLDLIVNIIGKKYEIISINIKDKGGRFSYSVIESSLKRYHERSRLALKAEVVIYGY